MFLNRFMIKISCIGILVSVLFQFQTNAQGSGNDLKFPASKDADIKIAHVMEVVPKAVRLLQHPSTGNLWYTTFDGEVYEIKGLGGDSPVAEAVFSAEDHGITRLQGAAFLNDQLFLCGNI